MPPPEEIKIYQNNLIHFIRNYFCKPSVLNETPIIINCHEPSNNPSLVLPIKCDVPVKPKPAIVDKEFVNDGSIAPESNSGLVDKSHNDSGEQMGDIYTAKSIVKLLDEHPPIIIDNEIANTETIESGSIKCSSDGLQLPEDVSEGTQTVAKNSSELESRSPKHVNIKYLAKKGGKLKLKKPLLIPLSKVIKNVHEPSFFQSSQDQIMIRTKMFNKFLTLQIDTGASISCISDSILKSLHPNYEKNLKSYGTKFGLSGVTGDQLSIKGIYKMPMVIPMLGLIYMKVTVVSNPNVRLLGMDFLRKTKMSLIYKDGKHHIAFEKSSINKMRKEEGIIYNDKEITLQGNSESVKKMRSFWK